MTSRNINGSKNSLFDLRTGGGYGRANNKWFAQRQAANIFPYIEITDLESDEFDDEFDDERYAIDTKIDNPAISRDLYPGRVDHSAFITGATRGISDSKNLGDCLVEILSGKISQGSQSYNVVGIDGGTRIRPGRTTGSIYGWSRPLYTSYNTREPAYTLRDISKREPALDAIKNTKKKSKKSKKSLKNLKSFIITTLIDEINENIGNKYAMCTIFTAEKYSNIKDI